MVTTPAAVKDIFLAALDKSTPQERAAYLDSACGGDEAVRREVEVLLAAHEQPDSRLDQPPHVGRPPLAATSLPEDSTRIGSMVGPYKLHEQIGEGGMGLVYMAEQQRPVRRLVALKVVKPGMDSRQVIARFEAERQALAMMDHANIARVLDAGTTEAGRPYFVMELVRGIPINEFCDQKRLTVRERLALFIQVCQAIQHAHQKGIIHRDLKPTNVLVTMHDAVAVPKVIDFGIAKALGAQLTDHTLLTGFAQMIGTPLYMSPEQAEMNQFGVDTRSDVYSLGVMLYELLTGTTPFDKETLTKAGLDEMRRLIREEEPPRPSARLSTLAAQALSTISDRRSADPHRISTTLRGELDWIVMKALDKDRNRRYESASLFAADIRRYLDDEPVLACPPSMGYRLQKFVRRNKRALTTTVLLCLALVLGLGGLGWVARDRAVRMAAVAEESTLTLQEAKRHQEQRLWTEALSAVKRVENLLGGDGNKQLRQNVQELRRDLEMVIRLERIRDEVMDGAGYEYVSRFDVEQADREYPQAFAEYGIDLASLTNAQAAQRLRVRSIATELAAALDTWALARNSSYKGGNDWQSLLALAKAADPDEWRGRLRDAWERKDRAALQALAVSQQVNHLPAQTLHLLGVVLRTLGDLDGAIALLRTAQQRHPDDFWINLQLAMYYAKDVKPHQGDEVLRYASAAIAIHRERPAPYKYLARELNEKGKVDEAIAANREAIRLKPDYWVAHYSLGVSLQKKKQLDEAITAFKEASQHQPEWAWAHAALAFALIEKGRIAEADAEVRETLRLNPSDTTSHLLLGRVFEEQGKLDEAFAHYQTAMKLDSKNADPHVDFGRVLWKQLKLDEALACFRKAIELDPKLARAHHGLGVALKNQGKLDEAIASYKRAIQLDPTLEYAQGNLGRAFIAQKKFDEAIACFRKAIELDPKYAPDHCDLGSALRSQKKFDEAIACFKKAIELDPKLANAHNNLGAALCDDQKKFDEAIACFKRAIELDPNYVNAHSNLGVTLGEQKKWDEAIAWYKKAIELDPKFAPAHSNLGEALCAQKKLDEAIACFKKAIELNPKYAAAHTELGIALKDQGKLDEAIACHKKAIELDPQLAPAHTNLGVTLRAQGKLDEAIASHKQAIKLDPKLARPHSNLGVALKDQGKLDEAIACYQQAIELDAKFAPAHNNLAWLLATSREATLRDPTLALKHAQTAVELDPTNSNNLNTLGAAHYRSGDWPAAITALEKSIELSSGGNSTDWLLLAMAHWQLGHKDEARTWFEKAVSHKPERLPDDRQQLHREAADLLGMPPP